MKKIIITGCLLAAILVAVFLNGKENTAKPAEFSVSIEDQTVSKGEEFTIHVNVYSSISMSKVDAYLEYDDTYLEYVGASDDTVTGASGMLNITETFDTAVEQTEFEITMRALEVGTTDISIKEVYLEDDTNSDIIEVSQISASVVINKNTSEVSDATLSELLVFPGNLTPEFNSGVTEYEVNIDADVEELILSAIPSSEDSMVEIKQPEKFVAGSNDVIITVTAPSGTVKTYHITANKSE